MGQSPRSSGGPRARRALRAGRGPGRGARDRSGGRPGPGGPAPRGARGRPACRPWSRARSIGGQCRRGHRAWGEEAHDHSQPVDRRCAAAHPPGRTRPRPRRHRRGDVGRRCGVGPGAAGPGRGPRPAGGGQLRQRLQRRDPRHGRRARGSGAAGRPAPGGTIGGQARSPAELRPGRGRRPGPGRAQRPLVAAPGRGRRHRRGLDLHGRTAALRLRRARRGLRLRLLRPGRRRRHRRGPGGVRQRAGLGVRDRRRGPVVRDPRGEQPPRHPRGHDRRQADAGGAHRRPRDPAPLLGPCPAGAGRSGG